MADDIQTGVALIQGIRNNGTPISITGVATFLMDTAKATHKFKITEGEDETGFDANLTATNPYVEADVDFKPSGADRDAAADVAVFLEPLQTVAMANFEVSEFNGNWIYMGDGSINLSHSHATMSLKLRKYKDATQNTSLNTTVS